MKNKIIKFWEFSIKNEFDKFDFEGFFSEFEKKLYIKLSGHGKLSFKDYLKIIQKYYNLKILQQFMYFSEHTGYKEDYNDVLYNLFYKRYKHFNKTFKKSKIYNNILRVYNKVIDRNTLTKRGKVFLIDECISLQHQNGFIINLDINKLRKRFENKYKRGVK